MHAGSVDMLSTESQVAITAVACSLVFFMLGSIFGVLCHYWTTLSHACRSKSSSNSKPTPPAGSTPVVYEEVSLDPLAGRKGDTELTKNVAYGPIHS